MTVPRTPLKALNVMLEHGRTSMWCHTRTAFSYPPGLQSSCVETGMNHSSSPAIGIHILTITLIQLDLAIVFGHYRPLSWKHFRLIWDYRLITSIIALLSVPHCFITSGD
ncbi:hypothetical protein F5146DRAFT_529604 [Armillaria mellea]|nr:hypothetical protein F5146DRAFT_529604 [Armillaria mellea]